MNENTYVGNVTQIRNYRTTRNGDTELSFGLAVDNGYRDRQGRWISDTVFLDVVIYRGLADNLHAALQAYHRHNGSVGMRVIVIGKFSDDSYTAKGPDTAEPKIVRQMKFVAFVAGPDLTNAQAEVTKISKTTAEQGMDDNRTQLTTAAA